MSTLNKVAIGAVIVITVFTALTTAALMVVSGGLREL